MNSKVKSLLLCVMSSVSEVLLMNRLSETEGALSVVSYLIGGSPCVCSKYSNLQKLVRIAHDRQCALSLFYSFLSVCSLLIMTSKPFTQKLFIH